MSYLLWAAVLMAGGSLILLAAGLMLGEGVGDGIASAAMLYLVSGLLLALVYQAIEWKRLGLLVLLLGVPVSVQAQEAKPAPKWAVALAAAGPIADGISTKWAMDQSGPYARIAEGNGFYHQLFGTDVTGNEILAVKVAQGALFGAIVHAAGRQHRKAAIGVALVTVAINVAVSSMNVRNGMLARDLNEGRR